MVKGKVKWFNGAKGYGFITRSDGAGDVFVHVKELKKTNIDALEENDLVEFEVIPGKKGEQAVNVKLA